MSTRLYPAWQKGSPQLRIFLPDFWMKLVKPPHPIPKYEVQFLISPQMTKYDVKQYLEKIYNVPVVHVNIHNKIGKTEQGKKTAYVIKHDDERIAYVTLPKDFVFEFPKLFPEGKYANEKKQMDDSKKEYERRVKSDDGRRGVPSWFTF